MIEEGHCYADNTPADQMKEERDQGIESVNRSLPPKKSIEIFKMMIEGDKKAKGWCIRAKMNMQDLVKCLRDPVLYRSNSDYHHRTGRKFKCYPTYDFACPIVDALEGVTHSMRSIEYKDRDKLYEWVQIHAKV